MVWDQKRFFLFTKENAHHDINEMDLRYIVFMSKHLSRTVVGFNELVEGCLHEPMSVTVQLWSWFEEVKTQVSSNSRRRGSSERDDGGNARRRRRHRTHTFLVVPLIYNNKTNGFK